MDNTDAANFLKAVAALIIPTDRLTQQGVTPRAVQPAVVPGVWTKYAAQLTGAWTYTYGAGGTTTARDGVSPVPGLSLGNAVISARYLLLGKVVRIKCRVTLGSSSVLTNLTWDPAGYDLGDDANFFISLPIKATADPFAFGLSTIQHTTHRVDSGGNFIQIPVGILSFYSNNLSSYQGIQASATKAMLPNITSTTMRYAGARTYDATNPGRGFWGAGDYIDITIKV